MASSSGVKLVLDLNPQRDENTRWNFGKILRWANSMEQVINNVTTIINQPGTTQTLVFPAQIDLVYPFVVGPSVDIVPGGYDFKGGIIGFQVTYGVMRCDPDMAAPTADTSFILQNDATIPTSSSTLTFASGSYEARGALAVMIQPGQRLWIKAPASLNGLQNLIRISLYAEALAP